MADFFFLHRGCNELMWKSLIFNNVIQNIIASINLRLFFEQYPINQWTGDCSIYKELSLLPVDKLTRFWNWSTHVQGHSKVKFLKGLDSVVVVEGFNLFRILLERLEVNSLSKPSNKKTNKQKSSKICGGFFVCSVSLETDKLRLQTWNITLTIENVSACLFFMCVYVKALVLPS